MGEGEVRAVCGALLELSDVSDWEIPGGGCYITDECSVATMFLYMVAELSALQQVINALTGLNGLPVVIVEVAITSIYTCTPDIYPPHTRVY